MTDLSPQAQAVLDAAFPAYDEENLYFLSGEQHTAKIAAGALRALVIQLQYYQCCEDEGVEDMVLDARAILDVADELEAL
tara:strand:- start:250 stop:489 length:240 start_codon:yes stop_codon:yes gene_type:complete